MTADKIEALFATAKSNGMKRRRITAGRLVIKTSTITDALRVTYDGLIKGRISAGQFHPYAADASVTQLVARLAADPATAMREIGKETGKCCCCGRELTDPESVAAGIGPICATNWGL